MEGLGENPSEAFKARDSSALILSSIMNLSKIPSSIRLGQELGTGSHNSQGALVSLVLFHTDNRKTDPKDRLRRPSGLRAPYEASIARGAVIALGHKAPAAVYNKGWKFFDIVT